MNLFSDFFLMDLGHLQLIFIIFDGHDMRLNIFCCFFLDLIIISIIINRL